MRKIIILTIMVLIAISSISAFGQKEDNNLDKVTGVPGVYGTEPHTYVCIVTEEGKIYYVHPDDQKKVRDLDRYKFTFTVRFIEGAPVSLDATFHKDGTVRVISWKKEK
ncbi:MAG: hypothetical protein PF693_06955 [Spirochaetia bacterium]|jgi:hypothetical protein|nr:hypothetical protein [Spirochaetia bacterium]